MADFDVEMIGDTPGDIESRLALLGVTGAESVNSALMDTAEEIKAELEDSSPVDTGEYQRSWYIFEAAEDEVWILNEADHAKFVMLPNQKMVGSDQADLPASGVLHNVKGVARDNVKSLNTNLSEKLQRLIRQFEVK